MSSIASFLIFMSGEDGSSMGASSEPPTTQGKKYRLRGLQAPRGLSKFCRSSTFDLDPDEHQVMLDYKAKMEKGRPKGFVKRYEIFMGCHTKEDGTYPKKMKEGMEYEEDGNGHARGYNGHLNKTNIRVSTPLRRVIERERGRRCSPPPPELSTGNSCILKDMFRTNAAYGTVQFNTTASKGLYGVIIDEVIRKEACLYVDRHIHGDVSAGVGFDGGGGVWVVAMAAVLRLGISLIRLICSRDAGVGALGCCAWNEYSSGALYWTTGEFYLPELLDYYPN
ncbi:hypothetical protein GIB67_028283, partial [Kingdonia uniflora]